MKVKYHIILGGIFTLIFWGIFPGIKLFYLVLMFLSSFLIDFDHYYVFVRKTGKISLKKCFEFYDKEEKKEAKEKEMGIRKRGYLYLLHTIEFHVLILALGYFFWIGFFYILIGISFHTLLDIIDMSSLGRLYRRWFFFSEYIVRKFK